MTWPEYFSINHETRELRLNAPPTIQERTHLLNSTLRSNRESGKVESFGKWNVESFALYSPSSGEHILDILDAGVNLFGIPNYKVCMLASTQTLSGKKFWVPRRSNKMRYPNLLDNFVGGSLATGEKPIDCIVREASEEASIPEGYTREHIKPCGCLSYMMTQTDDGGVGCQYQVQYVYEIELPEDMVPIPLDGEVKEFLLMGIEEVRERLGKGELKLVSRVLSVRSRFWIVLRHLALSVM